MSIAKLFALMLVTGMLVTSCGRQADADTDAAPEAPPADTVAVAEPEAPAVDWEAAKEQSLKNMSQLTLGMLMYSGEADGSFPEGEGAEGLKNLYSSKHANVEGYGKFLLHPQSTKTIASLDDITDENVSYIYLGSGYKDHDGMDMVLLVEKPELTPDVVAVAYLAGSPEYLSPEDAKAAVAKHHPEKAVEIFGE